MVDPDCVSSSDCNNHAGRGGDDWFTEILRVAEIVSSVSTRALAKRPTVAHDATINGRSYRWERRPAKSKSNHGL